MTSIFIREPRKEDKQLFIQAMNKSISFLEPWVKVPLSNDEFDEYIKRYQQPNQKSYLVCDSSGHLAGVFNISEIIYGAFQSAYLGFYATIDHAAQGYMREGLKLVLNKIFNELGLHRIEANIQPLNSRSIKLVKNSGFHYEGFSPRYLKINGEWRGHERWAMTFENFIRDDPQVIQNDSIDVIEHQPFWETMALEEIKQLKHDLKNIALDIQHIGSSAVPGLPAKPIIDILVAVNSLDNMDKIVVPILQKLGYEYWYENPDSTKMFFVKGMPPYGEKRTHHIHVVAQDSSHWNDRITFRNYLRLHPEVAKKYAQLKMNLAQKHLYDREKYTDEKTDFIQYVLKLARS